MKTFGVKNEFCIMMNLDDDYCGPWLNGCLCYNIKKDIIGDCQAGVSLRDAYYILESIVNGKEIRKNKNIFEMDYSDIFNLIEDANCGNGEELYQYIGEREYAENFSIRVDVESMLEDRIYSVSYEEKTKVIYRKKSGSEIFGLMFHGDIVEITSMNMFEYLKELHSKEMGTD